MCDSLHELCQLFTSEEIDQNHNYWAIKSMIQALLDAGADPDLVTSYGYTPRQILEKTHCYQTFRFKK